MNKLKLTLIVLFFQTTLIAQPQWKFHIAFEDATSAKDTIWFIFDDTATDTMDVALGEYPISMPTNQFQVYVYNVYYQDSLKVFILPQFYLNLGRQVWATNFVYPITIRWDTSLFHSPILSQPIITASIGNDYFFGVNNNPPLQAFDMTLTDSAFAPYFNWWSQSHFPMNIGVSMIPNGIGINELDPKNPAVFPNPSNSTINFECKTLIKYVEIFDAFGKIVLVVKVNSMRHTLKIEQLKSGIYFYKIVNSLTFNSYGKFIKN